MKRYLDFILAILALMMLSILFFLVFFAVRLTSTGPALYWSDRVGRHNKLFKMPKFRTMRVDTPAVATHLLSDTKQYLTPIGSFLRKTSLDAATEPEDMNLAGFKWFCCVVICFVVVKTVNYYLC